MSEKSAIRVKNVSKTFKLPHEQNTTIKSVFTNLASAKSRTKGYEIQQALKDVNFEVQKGEFFGVVGRNGSGKSTLLKILAGIYQPTSGSVTTRGKLVPFIELGVGFNPELTGRENVFLNGAMLGFSEEEIAHRYDDIVNFAELEDHMDQKLKNYSSGMQVRLAFSVAIQADAEILLIDEVLAVGDADFQRKCFNFFSSLKGKNTTVVFVSHDMDAIREYCDKAMLIEANEIITTGSPDEVAQEYLKLFNEQKKVKIYDSKDDRWGNGWVEYDSIDVAVKKDKIEIKLLLTSNRSTDQLVYGVRVRTAEGSEVMGTNTRLSQRKTYKLKAGEKSEIVWKLPNILSDGQYYIEPAIVVGDGATVCDWWDKAALFEIRKAYSTGYLVSPKISFEYSGASDE